MESMVLICLCRCRSFFHATQISLFRPLQEVQDVQLPIDVGSPRDLCFKHASESMELVWNYRRTFSLQHSSCIGLLSPYMVVLTVSPQLSDGPHKVEPFVRACKALVEHSDRFPVAPYILAMLKALDLEHGFAFPDEARAILNESNLQPELLDDISMEMRIPIPRRHLDRASFPGPGGAATSESVRELLARWVSPSSEEPQ